MAKATGAKPKKSIFTLDEEVRKKLKFVSVMDERDMQDVVNDALREYFAKWEKKHGEIKTPTK